MLDYINLRATWCSVLVCIHIPVDTFFACSHASPACYCSTTSMSSVQGIPGPQETTAMDLMAQIVSCAVCRVGGQGCLLCALLHGFSSIMSRVQMLRMPRSCTLATRPSLQSLLSSRFVCLVLIICRLILRSRYAKVLGVHSRVSRTMYYFIGARVNYLLYLHSPLKLLRAPRREQPTSQNPWCVKKVI